MTKTEKADWLTFWLFMAILGFDIWLAATGHPTISQTIHACPKLLRIGGGFFLLGVIISVTNRTTANPVLAIIRGAVIGHVFLYF